MEWYADKTAWFTPKFCIDYLHGHAGHFCSKNWAFLGKGNGYDKATAYREKYPAEALKEIADAK